MLLGIEIAVIPQLFLKILTPLKDIGVILMTLLQIGGRDKQMYNQELYLAEKFLKMLSAWGVCQYYYKTNEISDQCMNNILQLIKDPHIESRVIDEGECKIFYAKVK